MDQTANRTTPDASAASTDPSVARGVLLGRATGILMERHGIDAEAASAWLVAEARRRGTTVLECAAAVAGPPPDGPTLDAFQLKWVHGIDLTVRELEVLRLIAAGCTNAEIGARLYLSSETVKTHAKQLFAKLGVASRTQAAVWAYRSSCDPRFVLV